MGKIETKSFLYVSHDTNVIDGIAKDKTRGFRTYEEAVEYNKSLIADAEKYWRKQGNFNIYDDKNFSNYYEGDIIMELNSADGANCTFYPFGDADFNREEIYIDTIVNSPATY